jgi:hypothetical protein
VLRAEVVNEPSWLGYGKGDSFPFLTIGIFGDTLRGKLEKMEKEQMKEEQDKEKEDERRFTGGGLPLAASRPKRPVFRYPLGVDIGEYSRIVVNVSAGQKKGARISDGEFGIRRGSPAWGCVGDAFRGSDQGEP